MKPFVVNRYGRIVFPSNLFAELDFSVFETLEQFAAVIRRDFEEKAPTGTDIVARVEARRTAAATSCCATSRSNLFWVNRYADHHVRQAADAVARRASPARRRLPPDLHAVGRRRSQGRRGRDGLSRRSRRPGTQLTEDKIFRILLDVFRHKKAARPSSPPIKPTVAELLADPDSLTYHLLAYDPDYPATATTTSSSTRIAVAGAGGADAPGHGPAQPVPLGPRADAR